MFYEVRVLDSKGNVKKVISSKALSSRFWKRNFEGQPVKEPFDFEGSPTSTEAEPSALDREDMYD